VPAVFLRPGVADAGIARGRVAMTEHERLRQQRLAANQSLYRSVNEQIEALNQAFAETVGIGGEWVCECADLNCTVIVSAQLYEYESVRRNSRTFLVFPGHVFPEVERVVDENERFVIVEKLGAGAEAAEAADSRSR
jgi:hypothetical protein